MSHNQRKFVRVNRQITANKVRVRREEDHLGVMPLYRAMDLAMEVGLDLVEIVPDSDPPVCAIMDFSKFKYEEKRKRKDQQQKAKAAVSKEIRLRPVSGDHDVDIRINQLKKFLAERHPVSVNIRFKNRELQFKDRGHQIMERILAAVSEIGQVVSPPKFEGHQLSVRLTPKAA